MDSGWFTTRKQTSLYRDVKINDCVIARKITFYPDKSSRDNKSLSQEGGSKIKYVATLNGEC